MSKENLVKSVFEAIENKNLAKLKEIFEPLSYKVKREVLNGKSNSITLLEYAIQPHFFSDEIVEYLIKQGADPIQPLWIKIQRLRESIEC